MTAWPYEWREGMRLLAAPELSQPSGIIRHIDGSWLHVCGVGPAFGRLFSADGSDPRNQPDLTDDGTLGHLKGMVREAIKTSGCQGADLMAADYVLEAMDCVPKGGGKSTAGWYDPVTGRAYATEGAAYKAALDHLAKESA